MYPRGYVKVCKGWLKRLWGVEDLDEEGLSKQTDIMDACGALNGGDDIVPNKKDDFAIINWGNAVDFIDWFGV